MRDLKLLCGRSHPALAAELAKCLKTTPAEISLSQFANGEIICRLEESVRGHNVFVFQTHAGNINDAIIEQAIIIDAARRASASSITAVCPILGYARQDRKAGGREPITARLIVDILTNAGADRIISVDLHSGQTQGFFNGPFDHLIALPTVLKQMQKILPDADDLVIVSPDAGRVKTAERYSSFLNCDMAIVHKHRSVTKKNNVEARYLIGDVTGKTCVLLDDMIDTAGTLCAAAELIAEHGAKTIYAAATHGVLSDPAMERLDASPIKQLFISNTIPLKPKASKKIKVVSIAPLLSDAILAVHDRRSISALFDGKNQF